MRDVAPDEYATGTEAGGMIAGPVFQGVARVYIGPEPDVHHPGFRGPVVTDERGVHLTEPNNTEMLCGEEWVGYEGHEALIPWHRVHTVEWLDDA